jgi:hypothetical protein
MSDDDEDLESSDNVVTAPWKDSVLFFDNQGEKNISETGVDQPTAASKTQTSGSANVGDIAQLTKLLIVLRNEQGPVFASEDQICKVVELCLSRATQGEPVAVTALLALPASKAVRWTPETAARCADQVKRCCVGTNKQIAVETYDILASNLQDRAKHTF